MRGKRTTCGGRSKVRKALFMATLCAIQHNQLIKSYYQRLLHAGKQPMVALVACMRKILVILNALIRDHRQWEPSYIRA